MQTQSRYFEMFQIIIEIMCGIGVGCMYVVLILFEISTSR